MPSEVSTTIASKAALAACTMGVKLAVAKIKNMRESYFHEALGLALLSEGLSDEQVRKLLEQGLDKKNREQVYNGAIKSLLAESILAVQMIAVLTAKQLIGDSNSMDRKDVQLLRILTTILDEEILFLDKVVTKFWDLSQANSTGEISDRQVPENKIRIVNKSSFLTEMLNERDSEFYDNHVPYLKSIGLLSGGKIGSIPTSGSINEMAERLVHLYHAAQGVGTIGRNEQQQKPRPFRTTWTWLLVVFLLI